MKTYLLCSTPRTGSTLLCSLLKSSGVAGCPESYFRLEDMDRWAQSLQVSKGKGDEAGYLALAQVISVQTSRANGVAGVRVMWGTLDEIVDGLRREMGPSVESDLEVLQKTFGDIGFVYLSREDVIAQAVSWARAEQTNFWQQTAEANQPVSDKAIYDFDQIETLVNEINSHNQAWQNWFVGQGIQPLSVRYEELQQAPELLARQVLEFLGLELSVGANLSAPNLRMFDATSQAWIERFTSEKWAD